MSSIYSPINAFDYIKEISSSRNNLSNTSQVLYLNRSQNSKRKILREMNQQFRSKMAEVSHSLVDAERKYRQQQQRDNYASCSEFENKKYRKKFEDTKSTNLGLTSHYEQPQTGQICYESVIEDQKNLQREISDLKFKLGIKIQQRDSVQLEYIPRKSQVDWNLLMKQRNTDIAYKQLFKVGERSYIAYTEQTTTIREEAKPTINLKKSKLSDQQKRNKIRCAPSEQDKYHERKNGSIKDIKSRILHSPCMMNESTYLKQADRTTKLFNRLSHQKKQRENLLRSIKIKLK